MRWRLEMTMPRACNSARLQFFPGLPVDQVDRVQIIGIGGAKGKLPVL
jgi:hypothetical protein